MYNLRFKFFTGTPPFIDKTHALRRETTCSLSVSAIFFYKEKRISLVKGKVFPVLNTNAYMGSNATSTDGYMGHRWLKVNQH
jgi:hypothetical protein